MVARYATPEEIADWNSWIIANPDGGNVFSGNEFLQQKKLGEYRVHYIMADRIAVGVLEKSTPPFGKLWYLPKGPNVTTTTQLLSVIKAIRPLARKRGVFAIRIESELPRDAAATLEKYGLIKAEPIIPNPSTITLDIAPDLKTILASLPQKGRHAIRRAERDGVTIKLVNATAENCRTMYKLWSETAEGRFGIRSYNYYKTFWQRFEKAGYGQLFFAYFNGEVNAGAYAMVFGKKSTYKDGASTRKRTAYGASHLLQWKVIEWAKSHGAIVHDFCGSPPSEEIDNVEHPHYGLGRFKLSFSRHIVDYIGCYDDVLRPVSYKLWLVGGERLYRHNYHKRTNDFYY
jgi:lipid II:glycine glycyltransferase (peptidoglycan interpeptide bridge formation enzyme)